MRLNTGVAVLQVIHEVSQTIERMTPPSSKSAHPLPTALANQMSPEHAFVCSLDMPNTRRRWPG
jgi:hypothetical protein